MPARRHVLAIAIALGFSTPLHAEDADAPRLLTCEDPALPRDMLRLCEGLEDSLAGTMADAGRYLPGEPVRGPAPVAGPRPRIAREFTLRGVHNRRDANLPIPLRTIEDRGVGVRFRSAAAPLQFSTEFVQPGDPGGDERLHWELRAERDLSGASGIFWGARSTGDITALHRHASAGGFLGVRGVVEPADHLRLTAEVRRSMEVVDLDTLDTAGAVEPALGLQSDLGTVGGFEMRGSMNLGSRLPLDGHEASHSANLRITLTRK